MTDLVNCPLTTCPDDYTKVLAEDGYAHGLQHHGADGEWRIDTAAAAALAEQAAKAAKAIAESSYASIATSIGDGSVAVGRFVLRPAGTGDRWSVSRRDHTPVSWVRDLGPDLDPYLRILCPRRLWRAPDEPGREVTHVKDTQSVRWRRSETGYWWDDARNRYLTWWELLGRGPLIDDTQPDTDPAPAPAG